MAIVTSRLAEIFSQVFPANTATGAENVPPFAPLPNWPYVLAPQKHQAPVRLREIRGAMNADSL
ncbi:hypothetical protein D3C87_1758710 [compost metagenome]